MKKTSAKKAAKMAGRTPDSSSCTIEISRIRPDPNQPRKFFDNIKTLSESLIAHGQLEPILVWWIPTENVYEIIAGERRYQAAKMVGMKWLKAYVWNEKGDLDEGDKIELQLVENAHRDNVLPLEQAAAIARLMKVKQLNASQVAFQLKLSKGTVSKLVAILDLDPIIQTYVDNGQLAPSSAYELTKLTDPVVQLSIAMRAVANGLTREEISSLVCDRRIADGKAPRTRNETPSMSGPPATPPTPTAESVAVESPVPTTLPTPTPTPSPVKPGKAPKKPDPVVSERANVGPLKDVDFYPANGWHVMLTCTRSANKEEQAAFFRSLAYQLETGRILGSERQRPDEPTFKLVDIPRKKKSA